MSDHSTFYKIRRKGQVLANRLTSYEFMSKVYYYIKFKKVLNLKNPSTFNEKIQWLKLRNFPYNQLVIDCTDKYEVRDYVENHGGKKYLNKLIGVWDSWEDVNWEELPNKFALKCTHGCGYNIIANDKSILNKQEVEKNIKKWMSEDFSLFNAEQHYTSIKPRIICEEHLGEDIIDYKFFCYNGKPLFFYMAQGFGHGKNERMAFYNLDGSKAPFKRKDYKEFSDEVKQPENLDEMIKISENLSKEFPFVRVDFFEVNKEVIFSEMTFTPGGGLMTIEPNEYDQIWGEWLNLESVM
ncbi:glycosyl transferase [Sporosarcina sp. Sa3CUA8]|uniref:Glycosyl transferase n=2 Tax=Sporosarcina gallistercoris TaxID=2762245 RepID=A0ABR8PMM5_9BACL|nr:glycosyl transferase [Sporosarcina gallistercoris]